ncbi:hypothetical protein WNY37_14795 [Henriciella sp. AS95]|uniref:hypothetical protein n=1 Tax=Henriciella sp. AS95 TaxID=3135782 RepID=UPI0031801C0D
MPNWSFIVGGVVGGFLIIAAVIWSDALAKLLGPKPTGDGRHVVWFSKSVSLAIVVIGSIMFPLAAYTTIIRAFDGSWLDILVGSAILVILGLLVPYFFRTFRSDFHTVYWNENEISGPSDIRPFGLMGSRTTIATSEIKRIGKSVWFTFVEDIGGRRIYWTGYHWGHAHLEAHLKSHLPDQPKQDLFSRLLKL